MGKTTITAEKRRLMHTLYAKGLLSCGEIADRVGCSRQSVSVILRKMNVDTSKRKHVVECDACTMPVAKTRAEVRKHDRHFCSPECYNSYLRRADVQAEVLALKIARKRAEDYLEFGGHSAAGFHISGDEVYVFDSREIMLEWKRTGLSATAMVIPKGKREKVTYKNRRK